MSKIIEEIKANIRKPMIWLAVPITPSIASEILEKWNLDNRPLKRASVGNYKKQMESGSWIDSASSLVFSKAGRLIDGQHRLTAIVESGISVKLNVQTGLPDEAFAVIDTGKNRNTIDVLTLAGFGDPGILGPAVKTIISYHNGQMAKGTKAVKRIDKATSVEVLEWIKANADHEMVVDFAHESKAYHKEFQRLLKPTYTAFLYLFGEKSLKHAREFFKLLSTGVGISPTENSSIYALRQKLVNMSNEKGPVDMVYKYALIIKTWNYWRLGKKVTLLKHGSDDDFPSII